MMLLLELIAIFGGAVLAKSPLSAASVVRHGFYYAAIFALTALSEEGFVRGYSLVQLSRAISFWPAAFVTSLLFGALHLTHKSETLLGRSQVGLFGLLMALASCGAALFGSVGFHAAWDFAETFIFGVPDSGVASAGLLLTAQFHGPAWLTGGSAGPDGSVFVLPTLALFGSDHTIGAFRINAHRPDISCRREGDGGALAHPKNEMGGRPFDCPPIRAWRRWESAAEHRAGIVVHRIATIR